ncbi:MAG: MFS transporter [Thermincola sp.]|jgi:EmrB/QacA subfamily drug resistance transporter|nr:MFS transporter [Thermincola sp.]MDT3702547.1 MFS transporter [Thermincola sp.]
MLAFLGVLLGMSSSIMMQTILATVLPVVSKDLGGTHLYSWVFSGYMVASTVTIPLFAKLADIYGRKTFYLGGMALFLAGTALSGAANAMSHLVIFRVLQGIGAGAVAPAAIAIISDLFPVEERGKMMGVLAAVQVLANIVGPLLGGAITDHFGWQWAFFAILPLGFFAMILVSFGLTGNIPMPSQRNRQQIDFWGGLLLGILAILLIQGFAILSTQDRWQAGFIFLLALAVFMLLLWQENKHQDPVVSVALLTTKNVGVSMVSTLLLGGVMYCAIILLPLYGQKILAGTATQGGKLLIPLTLGAGIGGMISGRLSKKLSYANLAVGGWLLAAGGFLLVALISKFTEPDILSLAWVIFIAGLGLGAALPAFLLPVQNAVPENKRAVAAGLFQLARNLGGALGIPLFSGIIGGTKDVFFPAFMALALVSLPGIALGLKFKGSVHSEVGGDKDGV